MIASMKGKSLTPGPSPNGEGSEWRDAPDDNIDKGKSLTPGPSPNGEGSEWRDAPDDNINEGTAGEKRKKFR